MATNFAQLAVMTRVLACRVGAGIATDWAIGLEKLPRPLMRGFSRVLS
jgi:hypothetical protein